MSVALATIPAAERSTRNYWGSIALGRGTPWQRIRLVDGYGIATTAEFMGVTERADDGQFYGWSWQGTRLRLIEPPRLLPWRYRERRGRLMGRTIDGRFVGPFTVEAAS